MSGWLVAMHTYYRPYYSTPVRAVNNVIAKTLLLIFANAQTQLQPMSRRLVRAID